MAVYRKDVYCEFEFLKKFRSSNGHFSPLESTEALGTWLNVAKFIQKSHLLLNVNTVSFKKSIKPGDTLFSLWKKSTEGVSKMSFLDDHKIEFFENLIITPEGLNKVYLLAKQNAICKDWAEKAGTIVLSPTCWQSNEEAKKHEYLFGDCGYAVTKNDSLEWNAVLRSEYCLSNCNAMILIDNYIHDNINNNLLAIVDRMLPKKLYRDTEYHLTILTEKNRDKDLQFYDKMYKSVVEKISKSRPELKCKVELYVMNGKGRFHDRTILTNNVKIDSGAGFALKNENGRAKNSTNIHILHPGIQSCSDSCDISYVNILEEAKRFISRIERVAGAGERFPKDGSCHNRLIIGIDQ